MLGEGTVRGRKETGVKHVCVDTARQETEATEHQMSNQEEKSRQEQRKTKSRIKDITLRSSAYFRIRVKNLRGQH